MSYKNDQLIDILQRKKKINNNKEKLRKYDTYTNIYYKLKKFEIFWKLYLIKWTVLQT